MAQSKLSPKARLLALKAAETDLASVVMELGRASARDDVARLLVETEGAVQTWTPDSGLLSASVPVGLLDALSDIRGVTFVELAEPMSNPEIEGTDQNGPP